MIIKVKLKWIIWFDIMNLVKIWFLYVIEVYMLVDNYILLKRDIEVYFISKLEF